MPARRAVLAMAAGALTTTAGCADSLLSDGTGSLTVLVDNPREERLDARVVLEREGGGSVDREVTVPAGERAQFETEVANEEGAVYRVGVAGSDGVTTSLRVTDAQRIVGFYVEVSASGTTVRGLQFSGGEPQPVALESFARPVGGENTTRNATGSTAGGDPENTTETASNAVTAARLTQP